MSKLRQELDQARKRHEARRYPGDLANDLGIEGHPTFSHLSWRRAIVAAAVLLGASTVWWLSASKGVEPTNTASDEFAIKTIPWKPAPPLDLSKNRILVEPQHLNPAGIDLFNGLYRIDNPPNPRPPIGVRLTSTPQRPKFDSAPRRPRFDAPERPRSLSVGLTPRRFPSVRLKNFKSPTPSHRSNRDDKPDDDLT